MAQQALAEDPSYVVFVRNMSLQVTESTLRAMVEPFGTVQNISIVSAHAIDDSCGFAFVEMTDESAARRAIAELNGKSIDGRCLTARLTL